MKKQLSTQQLIELAKKAKPVPVGIEQDRRAGGKKIVAPLVVKFIQDTGIQAGRNPITFITLYDAYCLYTDMPVAFRAFKREMKKLNKTSTAETIKLNMKEITILEKIKDLRHEEKENEIQTE